MNKNAKLCPPVAYTEFYRYYSEASAIEVADLADDCTQNFHLRSQVVGFVVGNFVLRRRASGAAKRNLRP